MNYGNIRQLNLEANCVQINQATWDRLMKGAVRANHKKINQLVKKLLPDLYNDLTLKYPNPYNYYRTKTHLILVHSAIEYFIRYE